MRHRRQKISGIIATLIIALFTWGYHHFVPLDNTPIQNGKIISAEFDTSKIWSRGPTGNAAENAAQHFKKHGKEFGFKTEIEYVSAAIAFTTHPPKDVLKNIQRDGDTAFYNPKTAEYAVKSKKGFIRTYFKLNPTIHGFQSNTDYFNAQAAGKSPQPANNNEKR